MITKERLHELLKYEPATGVWTWRVSRGGVSAGSIAGQRSERSQIRVDRTLHLAHRLAFLYMTGELPPNEVDHIDGNPNNGRWDNLRLATKSQNQANRLAPITSKSGVKGVRWHTATGKWAAEGQKDGVKHHLGVFSCRTAAQFAYAVFAQKHHKAFAKF